MPIASRGFALTCLALLLAIGLAAPSWGATGLTRNGRWFQYNGAYKYLVGYDCQSLAVGIKSWKYPSEFYNYDAALQAFSDYGINKVRLWMYVYEANDPNYYAPWAHAVNGTTVKYDLNAWDPEYWRRMRDFVGKAEARGIMVELSLISAYPAHPEWWAMQAWNKANNVNGVFSSPAGTTTFSAFYDTNYSEAGKSILAYQRALVDKTLLELNGYSNVYYELSNEFPGEGRAYLDAVYPWQLNMADYLKARTTKPVTCHSHEGTPSIYGVEHYWNHPTIDILGFHFNSLDPNQVSSLLHGCQVKGKVIQSNESWAWSDQLDAATRESWAFFTSGGYYAYYHPDYLLPRIGDATWQESARRLRALRNVAESVPFWTMSPVDSAGNEYDSLVKQGPGKWQVIANPGSHYVAYFWSTTAATSTSAVITMPSGTYSYQWIDVRNGNVLGSGSVASNGSATIASPAPSAWLNVAGLALVIKSSSAPADTTPPVISGINASSITTSGATITWSTNEASDTQIEYGTTTSYGSSTALSATKITAHSQALSGLSAGTLYHYRVKSRDAANNLATSGDQTFTTSTVADTTPPIISAIGTSSITTSGATINWTTNEAADSQVEYGLSTSYGSSTAVITTMSTMHAYPISGLSAGTTYHYRVKSKDAANNLTTSGDQTFLTSGGSGTQTPYSGTPMAIPGTIRVSQYDNGGEGVAFHDTDSFNQMSNTFRPGLGVDSNGSGVGWIYSGEWLEHTITVSAAGTYTMSIPVSQTSAGGAMHVSCNGVNVTGTLSIPNTGDWNAQQMITKSVSLSAGTHVMLVAFDTPGANGYGPGLWDIVISNAPASGQKPFSGAPMAIPGTIAVAKYDNGGEGVAYHDLTAENYMSSSWRPGAGVDTADGKGMGWIQAGEWVEYTVNVSVAGTYTLSLPVCHAGPGGTFHVNFNGVNKTGSIIAPNTGSWDVNQAVSKSVNLSAGVQVVQVVFDTNGSTGYACGIGDMALTSMPTGAG